MNISLNIDKIGIRHDSKGWLQVAFQVDDASPCFTCIAEDLGGVGGRGIPQKEPRSRR